MCYDERDIDDDLPDYLTGPVPEYTEQEEVILEIIKERFPEKKGKLTRDVTDTDLLQFAIAVLIEHDVEIEE